MYRPREYTDNSGQDSVSNVIRRPGITYYEISVRPSCYPLALSPVVRSLGVLFLLLGMALTLGADDLVSLSLLSTLNTLDLLTMGLKCFKMSAAIFPLLQEPQSELTCSS